MQVNRSLIDRLQLLSSTLSSQITDSHERERVRRRLNEITHRWTELEQDIVNEEETMDELRSLSEAFSDIHRTCDRWLQQTQGLNEALAHAEHAEMLEQLIPQGKSALTEYQTSLEHVQRLRNRLNRLVQTNKTPAAAQKVRMSLSSHETKFTYDPFCFQLNEVDRLVQELTRAREMLQQRLDAGQKVHSQWTEFKKQLLFYEQWFENIQRTSQALPEQKLTTDERRQRYHDIRLELDKRRQILSTLVHEYPLIAQQITPPTQELLADIERVRENVVRQEEVNVR